MKLYLDDLRDPPDQTWTVARSYEEAVALVAEHGFPEHVSFDHDLGGEQTGLDFAHYLVRLYLDEGTMPANFGFDVHSANVPGSENIEGLLTRYLRWRIEERT